MNSLILHPLLTHYKKEHFSTKLSPCTRGLYIDTMLETIFNSSTFRRISLSFDRPWLLHGVVAGVTLARCTRELN